MKLKTKTCYIERSWSYMSHNYFWVDVHTKKEGDHFAYEAIAILDAEKKGYKVVRKPK